MARTRHKAPQPRSAQRKPYPANRIVRSTKKPPQPGMQAFNSKNGFQELAHQKSHKPQNNEAQYTAFKLKDLSTPNPNSETPTPWFISHHIALALQPFVSSEKLRLCRLPEVDMEFVGLLLLKNAMIRAGELLNHTKDETTRLQKLLYQKTTKFHEQLKSVSITEWLTMRTRSDVHKCWEFVQPSGYGLDRNLWNALLFFYLPPSIRIPWIDVPRFKTTTIEAQSKTAPKRVQHEIFVTDCLRVLERARALQSNGNTHLMEVLQEFEIPRLLWETGWKLYLDYLEANGLTTEMEAFLQKAYLRIYELQQSMPEFAAFWETCWKGLDEYSRRIHDMRLKDRREIPPLRDKGGRVTKEVDFVAEWAKPISEFGCKVLNGWSHLRNLVKRFVYVKVGFVFCEVDAW